MILIGMAALPGDPCLTHTFFCSGPEPPACQTWFISKPYISKETKRCAKPVCWVGGGGGGGGGGVFSSIKPTFKNRNQLMQAPRPRPLPPKYMKVKYLDIKTISEHREIV